MQKGRETPATTPERVPWFKGARVKDSNTAEVTVQKPDGSRTIYELSTFSLVRSSNNGSGKK